MNRALRHHRLPCLVGIGVVGLAALIVARAIAEGKTPKQPGPQPPANVAAAPGPNAPNAKPPDFTKRVIELPGKKVLAKQTAPAPGATADRFVNPKVQPGKVRWHKDFEAACAAAKKSGKPVLLFQMMGKLDDRFC